jgi:aminopeptidase N
MRLKWMTLLASAAFALTTLFADTYPRQPGIDALHYTFKLSLTDANDEIQGDALVELRFNQDGVTEFSLDLASVAGEGKGMTVTAVTPSSSFTHANDRLRIVTGAPSKKGERRQFRIVYHGVPAAGFRIMKNKYNDRVFFSENWPDKARHWLPMIDHPYDKATSEFLITAPVRYQVIANGLLREETDLGDGRRLTHWKQSVPIASWLNAVGAAEFSVHHAGMVKGVELQTWVYRQDREAGPKWFEPTSRAAIEFFSESIGPYSYEKLANIEAAGFSGGTEHASAIFYGEKSILERPGTGLIAHEIAHQWFGNAITETDWDDVWLSEGFATYFTLLFAEHSQGRDAFVKGLKDSRRAIYSMEKNNPTWKVRHNNLADMKQVLQRIIYQKGGWTLHMLREMIGTDVFWTGIRDYYQRYRNGSATTADFQRVMEEASGKQLGWFFDQWLNRAGSPAVTGNWRYNAASKRVIVELQQSGDYRLPIEIALGDRVESVELNQKSQTFTIAADKEPTSVVLDPATKILIQTDETLKKVY